MDGDGFGDDHSGPAKGAFQKVALHARPRNPEVGHVGGMGAEHDAVAQGLAAQGEGREQDIRCDIKMYGALAC